MFGHDFYVIYLERWSLDIFSLKSDIDLKLQKVATTCLMQFKARLHIDDVSYFHLYAHPSPSGYSVVAKSSFNRISFSKIKTHISVTIALKKCGDSFLLV